jgi:hypothetical protein
MSTTIKVQHFFRPFETIIKVQRFLSVIRTTFKVQLCIYSSSFRCNSRRHIDRFRASSCSMCRGVWVDLNVRHKSSSRSSLERVRSGTVWNHRRGSSISHRGYVDFLHTAGTVRVFHSRCGSPIRKVFGWNSNITALEDIQNKFILQ